MKSDRHKPDYILLSVAVILLLLGIVIIVSVSTATSQEKFGSPNFYLFHHLIFGILLGILLGFAAYKLSLAFWKKWAAPLLLFNLFLMLLVLFPIIGITSGGANRWINLGFTSLQPSEFLKLTFILYLASWLPSLKEKVKNNLSKTLAAFLTVVGLIGILLILQSNVSTLSIIVICGILMYFISGTPIKHSLAIILGGLIILALLIKIAPYRLERIAVFIKPDIDPMGISYQVKQLLITVGSGGILGKGPGMSLQKFGFLPQPMGDSIFAFFAEETGFIGGLILILLFLIFTWRGLKIAKEMTNSFNQLACLGITSWITIQALVNIGAIVGILPLTGIPLPFISYGGSAMVAELVGVGILLNISKKT